MIQAFKSEFERIAGLNNAQYVTKSMSELEDYTQNYDFSNPLINLVPIDSFGANIGASSQVIYNGVCRLQFITKAVKSDNYENIKDILIDQMIDLSTKFYRELDKNANLVFISPRWDWNNEIKRNYLSQYCIAVESTITFNTSCSRI